MKTMKTMKTKPLSPEQITLMVRQIEAGYPLSPYEAIPVSSKLPLDARKARKRSLRRSLRRLQDRGLVRVFEGPEALEYEVDKEAIGGLG